MAFSPHDVVPDSPINNFATLNPLTLTNGAVLSEGALYHLSSATNVHGHADSTISIHHKIYFEMTSTNNAGPYNAMVVSIMQPEANGANDNFGIYINNYNNGSFTQKVNGTLTISYPAPAPYFYAGNILGVFFDPVTGYGWFHINGTWDGNPSAGTNPRFTVAPNKNGWIIQSAPNANHQIYNFGQDPSFGNTKSPSTTYTDANGIGSFYYEPPEEALALCTANIPSGPIKLSEDQTPSDNFKAVTYAGVSTGSGNFAVPVGFQSDLIWIKRLNNGNSHNLFDSVRGFDKWLISDYEGAERNNASNNNNNPKISTVNSSGFTVHDNHNAEVNDGVAGSASKYIAWCWRAAGSSADGGSSVAGSARIVNEDGTQADTTCDALANAASNAGASNVITPSKISANQQNGFSIVKWSGNDTAGATYPHGFSQAPELIITKCTNASVQWIVYSSTVNSTGYLSLTDSFNDSRNSWFINNTPPSSSVITSGYSSGTHNDSSHDYITYCWHSVSGYSKIGSYTGSSNGPYVECGFRPAWVMTKLYSHGSGNWWIFDSARSLNNPSISNLYPNLPSNETNVASQEIDLLSNGFKIRNADYSSNQGSGYSYIYMAFAEQPFAAPSNAR